MLLGLVLVAALWWTYFDGDSERAAVVSLCSLALAMGVYLNAGIELVFLAVVLIIMHVAEARRTEQPGVQ
jgi:uncharacterized membrane protein